MISAVAFEPDHMKRLLPRECFSGEQIGPISDAVTLMSGGNPIAVIGYGRVFRGVIHVWSLLTNEVTKHPLAFHKMVLSCLDFIIETERPRRIQMAVLAGYITGMRWAESLGFEREGLMGCFGDDGSDYWLYARIIK
jgi:hypothetical protein